MTDCSGMGLNCGRITDATGQCFVCGVCTPPSTCGGGGQANVCGCAPRVECEVGECGLASDGCGGTIECGACAAPAECGVGGRPNRCAIVAGPGEACDDTLTLCPSAYQCCAVPGRGSLCLEPLGSGLCPTSGIDLEVDAAALRRSVRVLEQNVPGPMCPLFEGCELAAGDRKLLRLEPTIVNTGTSAFSLGEYGDMNPLLTSDVCTDGYKIELLTWRLLREGQVEASGALRRTCVDDFEQRHPTAGRAQFNCSAMLAGISGGWASVLRPESGCRYVDVTTLPPGDYTLELAVNQGRKILELDYANNVATATVTIP